MVNNRTNKTVLYIFLFSIFNKTEILTLSSEKAFLFESRLSTKVLFYPDRSSGFIPLPCHCHKIRFPVLPKMLFVTPEKAGGNMAATV